MMHFTALSTHSNQQSPIKKTLTIVFLFSLLISTKASASSFKGFIEKMIVGRDGHQIYVHMKDAPQTCGTDHPLGFNYAISLNDHSAGKEIFSAMMASQMSNRKITIQGTGACSIDSTMENISYVYIYGE